MRGQCALSAGKKSEAGNHLASALQILAKLQGELSEPAAATPFLTRPDLKADLVELARSLKQVGMNTEGDRIAALIR